MNRVAKFLLIFVLILFSGDIFAQIQLDINVKAKDKRKIPLYIVKFKADVGFDDQINNEIMSTITKDLEFSNNFLITFSQGGALDNFNISPAILKQLGKAEFIIQGEISKTQDNNISIKMKIFDLFLKKEKLFKNYYGSVNLYRKVAHKISNEIVEALTGEKGIFENKIVYVANEDGLKQIYLVDYDGSGKKVLVKSNHTNIDPKIYGDTLYFTSFENGRAGIYKKDFKTGQIKLIFQKGSFSAGADLNPKTGIFAMMFEDNGDAEIGLFNMNGELIKKITDNSYNEANPVWSHNGKKIAYVSSRTGTPQIYIYDLERDISTRLTFNSKYSAYPAWGHDDTYLYFSSFVDGKFKICRMGVSQMHYEQLTFGEHSDEFVSVSEDGKYLLFTRLVSSGRQIFVLNLESAKIFQVTNDKFDKSYPTWYNGNY